MDKETLKKLVCEQADHDREAVISLSKDIYAHPETGYKEVRTTEKLADALSLLGLPVDKNIAVTGCRAYANQEKNGPKIVVMGELDSVICRDHPDCDKETGAVHACGHNFQVSVMYGVADVLIRSGVIGELSGKVDFMAVPAEEYIELDYRKQLREEGKLRYYAGKPELISKGAFDDVDMCMMVHNWPIAKDGFTCASMNTGNGFIGKKTWFIGKQSHAGQAPWDGINALNMCTLAINNMHAQRETFKDSDRVRVHQIINKGGDIVNSVPANVELETTVRARTVEALRDANNKVNRAIRAAAITLGGEAVVEDAPGQMPMNADPSLAALFKENAARFYPEETIMDCMEATGSFDMGDISLLMPILHGITTGVSGGLHGPDYRIENYDDALITPVKILACTVIDLLYGNAEKAREIKENFRPVFDKKGYLDLLASLECRFDYKD